VYFPHVIRLMSLQNNRGDAIAVTGIQAAQAYYMQMDNILTQSAWLAGDYSFADIAFYMAALFGERQVAPMTTATPKLMEGRDRMTQRSGMRQVVSAMASWLKAANRPVPEFMLATLERK
jgi:glutathione S-transferase